MQNVAFIVNPFSAKKNYHAFLTSLQRRMDNPKVYISESVQGTYDFIDQNFETTEIFIAVGGDGTLSVIAEKLINTDKILGAFPAGSGNGFSKEMNFSKDLDQLLEKISTKKSKSIDTFMVNERFSINVSGSGFDAAVVEKFEKTSRGFLNYIKLSIKTYLDCQPIVVSFEEKYKNFNGKYLMLNLANTRQFGNNAYISPNSKTSDGLIELCLVKKFPLLYGVEFAVKLFRRKLKENFYLKYLSVQEINFSANTDIWHIDGEFCKIKSPVKIKVLPKSLKILV